MYLLAGGFLRAGSKACAWVTDLPDGGALVFDKLVVLFPGLQVENLQDAGGPG